MGDIVRVLDVANGVARDVSGAELCAEVPLGMDVLAGVAAELAPPRPQNAVVLEYPVPTGELSRARLAPFRLREKPDGEFLFRSADADERGRRLWHVGRLAGPSLLR